MHSAMFAQVTCQPEPLVANLALKRAITSVNSMMLTQQMFRTETFTAIQTPERLGRIVQF